MRAGLPVQEIHAQRGRLEDTFRALTGGGREAAA